MGRELSTIVRDLPIELDLEAARLGDYDRDTVVRLFREYEFRTLIERLPPMAGESAERADRAACARSRERLRAGGARRRPAGGLGPGPADRAGPPSGELQLRLDFDAVSAAAAAAGAGGTSGERDRRTARVDAEPTDDLPTALAAAIVDPGPDRGPRRRPASPSLEPLARGAAGGRRRRSSPTTRGRAAGPPLALAVAGADGRVVAADGAEAADALRHLARAARHAARRPRGQAAPRRRASPTTRTRPPPPVAFDTQIAAYILNAALRSQTIADVVAEHLDLILPPPTELPATARAGLEALSALAVREPLERRLDEVGLDRLFREIELPLIPVLARMEAAGVALDLEALGRARPRVRAPRSPGSSRRSTSTSATSSTSAAPSSSSRSCSTSSNLPKGKRTKTGYSTDASVLEELRPAHPMIDKLLEWRIYTKLRSTYVEALPTLIAADGRLHTTFHQAVASTGRLSSSDPNLQNIPIRTDARAADPARVRGRRARPGRCSPPTTRQIELRILAHVSGDEHLKDAFARQADIHRETAARVLHKDPADDHPRTSARWPRWSTSGWPTG